MFFFQDHSNEKLLFGEQVISPLSLSSQTVDTDLVFWVERYAQGCMAGLNFRQDLWQESTVAAMRDAFNRLLTAFLADSKLSILEPAMAALPIFAQQNLPKPQHLNLWSWLKSQAESQPNRVAIRTLDGQSSSYAQVLQRSQVLAAYLQDKGVQAHDVVGVCLSRNLDLIPTLWAILGLGASYLPLDPLYPSDRLQYMASDAQTKLVVTQIEHVEAFRNLNIGKICLDREAKAIAQTQGLPLDNDRDMEALAYTIYTSGSTGKPKGVEIQHRAVCYFLTAITQELKLKPGFKTLAITTISFDISVLEIFATLVNGGEVVLVDHESLMDGQALMQALNKHQIDLLQATPATWRLLLESGWQGKKDLVGLCGGEALPKDLARSLVPIIHELWNVYGPTEATVWATTERIEDAEAVITIGKALPYYEAYILDANLQAVPQGSIGDLYLGGPALARGYRFRADLTAERFRPHPSSPMLKIYDTGDLARFRPDGKIEYIGRRDNQIKLRGFRIELGEIEASMMLHAAIKQAVCIVRQESAGDSRLVAYAVLQPGQTMEVLQLHHHLSGYLPQYMLPNHLVVLEQFPLTGSGKIDKKALPAPSQVTPVATQRKLESLTPTETQIAEIFKGILGVQQLSRDDNFFEAGGHSLLALKVLHRLQVELGLSLKIRDLLMRSIAHLAHDLDAKQGRV